MDWQGKSAIIVGAGEGRGWALAEKMAAVGSAIFAVDANPDRSANLADAIRDVGGTAEPWCAEIANRFQVAAMIERARDCYGRITVLVNCADLAPRRELLTLDEWEWRRLVDVNLTGAFFCTQLMARVMVDEGGGLILHCHDAPAASENPASAATRAALSALATHSDVRLRSSGVRVKDLLALPAEEHTAFAERALELCGCLLAGV